MIRKYAFKVRINRSHGNLFLEIKPYIKTNRPGNNVRKMDPIYFSELNIPIMERTPSWYSEVDWDPEYFLDFENGFDENKSRYNESNKQNSMRIIRMLENMVDKDIFDFLLSNKSPLVKGKIFRFDADDGLSLNGPGSGYKKPKKANLGSAKPRNYLFSK